MFLLVFVFLAVFVAKEVFLLVLVFLDVFVAKEVEPLNDVEFVKLVANSV